MSIHVAWLTCDCGKLHCCAGVSQMSRCTCGRELWAYMWTHAYGVPR